MAEYSILDKINTPDDVKSLSDSEILAMNDEIRDFLVKKVTKTGGHLASNLGIVEITVALLRVFSPPSDRIIWDVGHQSYVYKMLTDRRDRFDDLRIPGGLSGFAKISESEYDSFGAGHSSTSLSAALGFAKADRLAGRDNYTVAVVGDGAYTGGMIHEALNNCEKDLKLIIILNENEMSISKNIGSFANYIARVRTSKKYITAKRGTTKFIKKIPLIGNAVFSGIKNIKKMFKNMMYGSNYFEELGLFYIGPADGNDYMRVESMLRGAIDQGQSVVIHLKTKKGKGYQPAEDDPGKFHCIRPASSVSHGKNFSASFGEKLCLLAENDHKICAVTASMTEGTGLSEFAKKFPERFFDVGIAEEHALTFCAGLSAAGYKPYIGVYSSFLQRGYDNLLHDIALQKLSVVIGVDRAGLNRADGATHHGIFDVSFLSSIPGIEIFAPISFESLGVAMEYASTASCPVAIRYPNGSDSPVSDKFSVKSMSGVLSASADFHSSDNIDCVIITYGSIISEAICAKEKLGEKGITCGIILLQHLRPYDRTAEEILSLLPDDKCMVIFLEEGIKNGGAAMIISSILSEKTDYSLKTKILAIDDDFVSPTEKTESLYKYAGISADDIIDIVK
ncbi:MAG: 1-deoxy-D-xylulose-5-phosphate synthase [Clostridia bacterium]|nr:1-deoxy-D-xylulose-5-phosphate synthase [Clostridia bacterium]